MSSPKRVRFGADPSAKDSCCHCATNNNNCKSHHSAIQIIGYHKSFSGVWFYDIEIWNQSFRSSSYTISRRYNDFQKLYEGLLKIYPQQTLPAFPQKTTFASFFTSPDFPLLNERSFLFQRLLYWIEAVPLAKCSKAYYKFRGEPPGLNRSSGYVSLNEYTTPNWYASYCEVLKTCQLKKQQYNTNRRYTCSILKETKYASSSSIEPNPQEHELDGKLHSNDKNKSIRKYRAKSFANNVNMQNRASMCV